MTMNTSIVLELQDLASDSQRPLTDLLRKALIVATKLKLDDLRKWLLAELNGYDGRTTVPNYRKLEGRLTGLTRSGEFPLSFREQHADIERRISAVHMFGNIAELEQQAARTGMLYVTLPSSDLRALQELFSSTNSFVPQLVISPAVIRGILDTVRNAVLEWALRLEQQGILGEGMSFSDAEKNRASITPSIHIGSIGSFTGNMGSVNADNIQIGDYSSINQKLKDAGISQAERNKLENLMDELKAAKPEEKPGLVQRGMKWVGKNASNLGAMAAAIHGYFQKA
jgi:hypothetical protein